jgi:hypothetical protein
MLFSNAHDEQCPAALSCTTAYPAFGLACPGTSTTKIEADGGNGGSRQSALYAPGGPSSAQFIVKLVF